MIKNGQTKEFTNKSWPDIFYIPGNLLSEQIIGCHMSRVYSRLPVLSYYDQET